MVEAPLLAQVFRLLFHVTILWEVIYVQPVQMERVQMSIVLNNIASGSSRIV